jgi:hypothetical protein
MKCLQSSNRRLTFPSSTTNGRPESLWASNNTPENSLRIDGTLPRDHKEISSLLASPPKDLGPAIPFQGHIHGGLRITPIVDGARHKNMPTSPEKRPMSHLGLQKFTLEQALNSFSFSLT